jgi:hypothetical protein
MHPDNTVICQVIFVLYAGSGLQERKSKSTCKERKIIFFYKYQTPVSTLVLFSFLFF